MTCPAKNLTEFACTEPLQSAYPTPDGVTFLTARVSISCDVNKLRASGGGSASFGSTLLQTKPTFHVPQPVTPKSTNFQVATIDWMNKGEVPTSEQLLKALRNEDINCYDAYGVAPLHRAVTRSLDLVNVLLDAGANPIIRTDAQLQSQLRYPARLTALHLCISLIPFEQSVSMAEDLIAVLLSGGADPNVVDDTGAPPLREAVNRGYLRIAEMLLRGGADPNASDKRGASLLTKARLKAKPQVEELLCQFGALE
ncbi:MAG TPA: ankyrin repeat domain-containing protein [Fimbriimonadaceae bacterium]|jgi:ankyrin repeat protein